MPNHHDQGTVIGIIAMIVFVGLMLWLAFTGQTEKSTTGAPDGWNRVRVEHGWIYYSNSTKASSVFVRDCKCPN